MMDPNANLAGPMGDPAQGISPVASQRDAVARAMMARRGQMGGSHGTPAGAAPMVGGMGGRIGPASAGTQAFDRSYNAGSGAAYGYGQPQAAGGLGGNLGLGGGADPSMWNASLPSGGWGY